MWPLSLPGCPQWPAPVRLILTPPQVLSDFASDEKGLNHMRNSKCFCEYLFVWFQLWYFLENLFNSKRSVLSRRFFHYPWRVQHCLTVIMIMIFSIVTKIWFFSSFSPWTLDSRWFHPCRCRPRRTSPQSPSRSPCLSQFFSSSLIVIFLLLFVYDNDFTLFVWFYFFFDLCLLLF